MSEPYPPVTLTIAELKAKRWIWGFSGILFLTVALLGRVQVPAPEGLDVHLFARINAIINSIVSILLVIGLATAKAGRWKAHRAVMLSAISLSALFLMSYFTHHLFAGDTRYGGTGAMRWIYYFVLITHIVLAAGSLPVILMTAFKALSGRYPEHRKLAKRVWPVWLYVSLTGVAVYLMIRPYY